MIDPAHLDTYEAICDAGREAIARIDRDRWYVGDLACLVETTYSEHNLDDFAMMIGISKRAAQQYRQVSAFYEKRTRCAFEDTNITYTHFRTAMKAGDKAIEWLDRACTDGWTCDQLAAALQPGSTLRDYVHKERLLEPSILDELALLMKDGIYISAWHNVAKSSDLALVGSQTPILT